MLLTELSATQPPVELHWLRVGHCLQLEALARRGAPPRIIEFPSYAAAIRRIDAPERGWTLVDTGYADHFLAATARPPALAYRALLPVTLPVEEELPRQLAGLGIDPADVRRIVVTHFHGDHVAGLRDYPAAEIVSGGAASAQILGSSKLAALRHGLLPAMLPEDVRDRLTPAEDGQELILTGAARLRTWDVAGDRSIVAVDLPGHMPGHLGVLLNAAGRPVLLVGDAAWSTRSIAELTPPSRLAGIAFDDWAAARGSLGDLHRLHQAHSDEGLLMLPAHCPDGFRAWHDRAGTTQ